MYLDNNFFETSYNKMFFLGGGGEGGGGMKNKIKDEIEASHIYVQGAQ